MGATRDGEADGTHPIAANADGTDEEGVSFGPMRTGTLDASITVDVQGGAARLDAWIDFNGDGSWGGPEEQIVASRNLVPGINSLTISVPSWAKPGTTYSRFRLSSSGGLGIVGPRHFRRRVSNEWTAPREPRVPATVAPISQGAAWQPTMLPQRQRAVAGAQAAFHVADAHRIAIGYAEYPLRSCGGREELTKVIGRFEPGEELALQLYRDGKRETLKVKLGEWE